jgi:hypothetical protein
MNKVFSVICLTLVSLGGSFPKATCAGRSWKERGAGIFNQFFYQAELDGFAQLRKVRKQLRSGCVDRRLRAADAIATSVAIETHANHIKHNPLKTPADLAKLDALMSEIALALRRLRTKVSDHETRDKLEKMAASALRLSCTDNCSTPLLSIFS